MESPQTAQGEAPPPASGRPGRPEAEASESHLARPVPKVLVLSLRIPQAFADRLRTDSLAASMDVETVASHLLDGVAGTMPTDHSFDEPSAAAGRAEAPRDGWLVDIKVPVARKTYRELLRLSSESGLSPESLAAVLLVEADHRPIDELSAALGLFAVKWDEDRLKPITPEALAGVKPGTGSVSSEAEGNPLP